MKNKLQIAIPVFAVFPVFAVCVAVVLISGKTNTLSDVKNECHGVLATN